MALSCKNCTYYRKNPKKKNKSLCLKYGFNIRQFDPICAGFER